MDDPDLMIVLRKRANETANAIREEARVEAESIRVAAQHANEDRRTTSLREEEDTRRAAARARIAVERRRVMESVLRSKAALLDQVLKRVQSLMDAVIRDERYRSTLATRVDECLGFLGPEGGRIRCTPDLVDDMHAAASGHPSIAVTPDSDVQHGFVIESRDGGVRIDEQLPTRLSRLRAGLTIEIDQHLGKL